MAIVLMNMNWIFDSRTALTHEGRTAVCFRKGSALSHHHHHHHHHHNHIHHHEHHHRQDCNDHPHQTKAVGWKATDWNLENPDWKGKMRMVRICRITHAGHFFSSGK